MSNKAIQKAAHGVVTGVRRMRRKRPMRMMGKAITSAGIRGVFGNAVLRRRTGQAAATVTRRRKETPRPLKSESGNTAPVKLVRRTKIPADNPKGKKLIMPKRLAGRRKGHE